MSGSPTTRSPRSATSRAWTCSTCNATSASTRSRGHGSGRGSPAPTSARPAIELARALAADLGIADARFVRSDLYDLPAALEGDFDIVYTSRGALNWLPDMRRWAEVAAHFVRPGGTFYITELHPVANVFQDEGVAPGELRLAYPYWEHAEPLTFAVQGSYADRTPTSRQPSSTAGTMASARL